MLTTRPTRTPRNFTGEPRSRPWIDSSKYTTNRSGREKKLMPPNENSATRQRTSAPRTNKPTTAGLTLVFTRKEGYEGAGLRGRLVLTDTGFRIFATAEEFADAGIRAFVEQHARVALG